MNRPWSFYILGSDRGRERRLSSSPPPSEPDGRISRIRLSSWWFTSSRIDEATPGGQQETARIGREIAAAYLHSFPSSTYAYGRRRFELSLSPTYLALRHCRRLFPSVPTTAYPPPCVPWLQAHYRPFFATMDALTPAGRLFGIVTSDA